MLVSDNESKSPSQLVNSEDASLPYKRESKCFDSPPYGRAMSPPPSPNPYIHPFIEEWELDVIWNDEEEEEMTERMKDEIRK